MNNRTHKSVFLMMIVSLLAFIRCNDQEGGKTKTDSLPGVVQPEITDSSGIKVTPKVMDSNAINTDSTGISR
jgi:hypothetical protein